MSKCLSKWQKKLMYVYAQIFHFRLEPILDRIREDRKVVVCPQIDVIDAKTLRYAGTGSESVGGFWWSLHFGWRPIPQRERDRRRFPTDPIRLKNNCAHRSSL